MDIKESIRKFALQNAIKFNGKANPGAVIGHLIAEDESIKAKLKDLNKDIIQIIKEVNSMTLENQKKELEKTAPELLEKKEKEKKDMPDLPNAEQGKVITRIPPEPSKYNHLGHALSFLFNYIYAKRYKGKSILRFEDTNPTKAKQEYVDAMNEDVCTYLDIKPDQTRYVSDDMEKFYELCQELIAKEKAFVCFCDRDKMQDLRHKGKQCDCRKKAANENEAAWQDMLKGKYDDGVCTLRLKIDMEHNNHVMRDPVIMRICKDKHYRQKNKYCVWPMYDFEAAVEEELCGITHILRSNEFGQMRVELQDYIKGLFNYKKQTVVQYGRFNIVGALTQGREIREKIEKKEVTGWDDPRLVTLKALKRRGIVKEMFYELVKEVGLSAAPTNLDWTRVSSINRRILDPIAHRYFIITKPVKIKIEGAPEKSIELNLHPDKGKGGRKLKTDEKFYIEEEDFNKIKDGKLYRLMDCLNFKKDKDKFVYEGDELEKYKKKGEAIIHWLPKHEDHIKIEIMMNDASVIKAIAEPSMKNIKEGEVVQAERFGFLRLDKKQKDKLVFWFTHK